MEGAENARHVEGSPGKPAGTDIGAATSSGGSGGGDGGGGGAGGKKVPSWLNSRAWSRPAKASADGGRPPSLSPLTPKGAGEGPMRQGDGGELSGHQSEKGGAGGGELGSGAGASGKEGGAGGSGVGDNGGVVKVGEALARAQISSEAEGIGGEGGLEAEGKGSIGGGGGGGGSGSGGMSRGGERAGGKEGWHEMEESGREKGAREGGGERDGGGGGGVGVGVGVGGERSSERESKKSSHESTAASSAAPAVKSPPRPGRPRAVTSPPSSSSNTPPLGPHSPRTTATAAGAAATRTSPSLLPIASTISSGLGLGGEPSTIISSMGGGVGGERRPSLLEQLRAAAFAEPIVVAPVLHGRGGGGGGGLDPFTLATASAEDQAYERRLAQFYMEISQPRINMGELRRLAMYGIPNEGSLRPVVWKLLLGLLPLVRDEWESELARKRRQYDSFTAELIINPSKHTVDLTAPHAPPKEQQQQQQQQQEQRAAGKGGPSSPLHPQSGPALSDKQDFGAATGEGLAGETRLRAGESLQHGEGAGHRGAGGGGGGGGAAEEVLELHGSDVSSHDHPLNDKPTSVWRQYFQDSEIFEQIDRDVRRTHPEMLFFTRNDGSGLTPAQEAMRRLLLIFAKLNPGIRYVQGMNEVLAPIVYVFANDPDKAHAVHAEPDAFFCFVELLSDFRDFFCQQLDNSVVGIRSAISRLAEILRRHDEELWRNLEYVSKVNPQFYAFRWITLLLTQEFGFPQILRIWDALLACPEGPMDMLLRVCCAMLMCVRERLLAGDFTNNLKLLQRYPRIDIEIILRTAERLHT
ncbi:hypothetical protein CLOM_g14614 [Closterium sp. NIES-68]|nr:hypothetical protein CLOM_g14614 [Closterium sp. NIES-68]GJP82457.1 hypothetical protein CLOP_g12716 [Closterium sp. NIES-67]